MKIEKIKQEMLEYRDFYGGDLLNIDEVMACETKDELKQILNRHEGHMEAMLSDAVSHLNHFSQKLGL